MPRVLKLPRCYKCDQAIRKSEYLQEPDGTARHIVCPLTPELRAWGAMSGIIQDQRRKVVRIDLPNDHAEDCDCVDCLPPTY